MLTQYGRTRSGMLVLLNRMERVPGGYEGYVLNARGVAVRVWVAL